MMIKVMLMADCGRVNSNIDKDVGIDGHIQIDDVNDSQASFMTDCDAQNNIRFAENRQTQLGVERFRVWAEELQLQENNLE